MTPIEAIISIKVLFFDILIKTIIPLSIGLSLLVLWGFKTWLAHQQKKGG